MRVRKVSSDGDYVFGGDQASFWLNVPDGVGQVVESRLNLWLGDWYLDLAEGTAYQTEVLGFRTEATRDPVLRDRILATPGVTEIVTYSSDLDRNTRALNVRAVINTAYSAAAGSTQGTTAVINVPIYQGR